MIKKYRSYFILMLIFLSIQVFLYISILCSLPLFKGFLNSSPIHQTSISYSGEKRGCPIYDAITGNDGLPHYRVFFWVPKTAKRLVPYADTGVKTDVSSHGPVEKWSVVETKTADAHEKLVFIFVPKTFVYLYGNGFEKVIHLKLS